MALLRLEIGAVAAERTGPNDKVGETVRQYAIVNGAAVDAPYQQLLDTAVDALVTHMVQVARLHRGSELAQDAQAQADAEIGFEE